MKAALNTQFAHDKYVAITKANKTELDKITELNVSDDPISNNAGIQYCAGLASLRLGYGTTSNTT